MRIFLLTVLAVWVAVPAVQAADGYSYVRGRLVVSKTNHWAEGLSLKAGGCPAGMIAFSQIVKSQPAGGGHVTDMAFGCRSRTLRPVRVVFRPAEGGGTATWQDRLLATTGPVPVTKGETISLLAGDGDFGDLPVATGYPGEGTACPSGQTPFLFTLLATYGRVRPSDAAPETRDVSGQVFGCRTSQMALDEKALGFIYEDRDGHVSPAVFSDDAADAKP